MGGWWRARVPVVAMWSAGTRGQGPEYQRSCSNPAANGCPDQLADGLKIIIKYKY